MVHQPPAVARVPALARVDRRVVVLYERGRAGRAALDLARTLAGDDGTALTVVAVVLQDTRLWCGAGSAMDYNRAVCDAAEGELREAYELLGAVGESASYRLLVQDKDPPLVDWVAAEAFDLVLLPARRRPLHRTKHPAAEGLRRSTRAEVRVCVRTGSERSASGQTKPPTGA